MCRLIVSPVHLFYQLKKSHLTIKYTHKIWQRRRLDTSRDIQLFIYEAKAVFVFEKISQCYKSTTKVRKLMNKTNLS